MLARALPPCLVHPSPLVRSPPSLAIADEGDCDDDADDDADDDDEEQGEEEDDDNAQGNDGVDDGDGSALRSRDDDNDKNDDGSMGEDDGEKQGRGRRWNIVRPRCCPMGALEKRQNLEAARPPRRSRAPWAGPSRHYGR